MDYPHRRASNRSNGSDEAESRMRDALGIGPGTQPTQQTARPRTLRPFAKDGQVQVEVVQSRRVPEAGDGFRERLKAVQGALDAERTARIATERTLVEARATIQQLQTKLAHNQLAFSEALATEQQARAAVQLQLNELTAAATELETVNRSKRAQTAFKAPERTSATRSRQQVVTPAKEPKPVKWWLPSYQAPKRK